MIKYKSSMFASRDGQENVESSALLHLILPIQDVSRHLNMECFESAVPAIFQS